MATNVWIAMKSLVPLRKNGEAEPFSSCREARFLLGSCPSGDDNTESLMISKVFLRKRETAQYYAGSNGWSGNTPLAHSFDTVESAIQFAKTERLAGMEVVLRFEDPVCELILPLRHAP